MTSQDGVIDKYVPLHSPNDKPPGPDTVHPSVLVVHITIASNQISAGHKRRFIGKKQREDIYRDTPA